VLWHSKPEIAQQHESKGDVTTESEEDQLAAMANTIVGGGQSKKTNSIKMTSFTTPVHEVFQHLHFRREQILEWMEKMNNQDLDRTLQGIVNVALQESTIEEEESRKTSSSFYGWQAVSTKPMMCRRVVESEHNYPPSTDQYVLVEFPGAELVSVFFDKRTSTEKDCDYVTFFKDETYTTHWVCRCWRTSLSHTHTHTTHYSLNMHTHTHTHTRAPKNDSRVDQDQNGQVQTEDHLLLFLPQDSSYIFIRMPRHKTGDFVLQHVLRLLHLEFKLYERNSLPEVTRRNIHLRNFNNL
jgi:hypothetical protein